SLAWAQMRGYWSTRRAVAPTEVIDRKTRILAPLLIRGGRRSAGADPAAVASEIEWAQVRLVPPSGYVAAATHRRAPLPPDEMAAVYAAYVKAKRDRGVIDFEDMLAALVETARRDPELAAELRARHRHVFVDEFQDT